MKNLSGFEAFIRSWKGGGHERGRGGPSKARQLDSDLSRAKDCVHHDAIHCLDSLATTFP